MCRVGLGGRHLWEEKVKGTWERMSGRERVEREREALNHLRSCSPFWANTPKTFTNKQTNKKNGKTSTPLPWLVKRTPGAMALKFYGCSHIRKLKCMQEIVRLPMPLQRHKYMIKSNICLLDSFSFPLSIENGKKNNKKLVRTTKRRRL